MGPTRARNTPDRHGAYNAAQRLIHEHARQMPEPNRAAYKSRAELNTSRAETGQHTTRAEHCAMHSRMAFTNRHERPANMARHAALAMTCKTEVAPE